MKSILQEANSIERAIDKAWNEAGKPKEFTIRVLDEGERNFLGLSRRPAIVSIFYKPEKITTPQHRREKTDEKPSHDSYRDRQKARRENAPQQSSNRSEVGGYVRDEGQERPRRYAGTEQQRASFQQKTVEGWNDEWKVFVLNEIRELAKHMGITSVAEATVTGDKLLTITFKQALLDNDDDQRMLFATFSYLGMQLLKRMYKSRFVGYRIIVTGPKADGSAMSADSEEQIQDTPEMRSGHQRSSQNRRNQSPEGGNNRSSGGAREGREGRGNEGNNRRNNDRRSRGTHDRSGREDGGQQEPRIVMNVPEHTQAIHSHTDDIAADQMKFAQEQLARASKASAPAQPLKKDQKYQPFFVIEDEESGK
jgi:predicted RNA-binding protein Jag